MKQYRGDFGGMNVDAGDFITPGTSGLGRMPKKQSIEVKLPGMAGTYVLEAPMGSSMGASVVDNIFSTIFGSSAEQAKAALQSGAATSLQNVVGTAIQQNPDAAAALKATIADTSKGTFETLWTEYKTPVIVGLVLLSAGVTLGVYNTFKKR